jgi:hypothetical protein
LTGDSIWLAVAPSADYGPGLVRAEVDRVAWVAFIPQRDKLCARLADVLTVDDVAFEGILIQALGEGGICAERNSELAVQVHDALEPAEPSKT